MPYSVIYNTDYIRIKRLNYFGAAERDTVSYSVSCMLCVAKKFSSVTHKSIYTLLSKL